MLSIAATPMVPAGPSITAGMGSGPPPPPSSAAAAAAAAANGAGEATGAAAAPGAAAGPGGGPAGALRFEDLTIDDSLPPLERVTRYCRSGIALQRLVHVKMLGEVAAQVGTEATIQSLIPLLPPLVPDAESIIRQNLAAQFLPISIALIHDGRPTAPTRSSPLSTTTSSKDEIMDSTGNRASSPQAVNELASINADGYATVIKVIVPYLIKLLSDPDLDTRRCASDSLSSLCARLKQSDVQNIISAAAKLAATPPDETETRGKKKKKQAAAAANAGPSPEDLRTVASNLLAEIAAISTSSMSPDIVSKSILPSILRLCTDGHFRVRRAAVQSLPRVMAGGTVEDAAKTIVPVFGQLSRDDMYRVRKSVGECLVDMSRSIMLLSDGRAKDEKDKLLALRREHLIPICINLLSDPNKFVRHGMQQFLGPFIASFYPLGPGSADGQGVMSLLESNATDHHGSGQLSILGARFFPHAAGMVGRLNPGSAAAEAAEAAAVSEEAEKRNLARQMKESEEEKLLRLLPPFLVLSRSDQATLKAIVSHRETHPPHSDDLETVRKHLIPPFVALAEFDSGDENLDAEMRVYCAYSLPGVILLMGRESWSNDKERLLRKCFLSLSTGVKTQTSDGKASDNGSSPLDPSPVPLPVKRCLASSFHTMCCILGRDIVTDPGDGPLRPGLLQIFEHYFLRDPDDTVRLNVMRTLPSLLSLLDPISRSKFLPTLYSIIVGDAVLGAPVRRSATNPQLLNWRQRDAVSQILPDLVLLYGPIEVRNYLWPVLKMLLADKVNAVRDDVEFCIPTVLRSYAPENVAAASNGANGEKVDPKRFSSDACNEVILYLKQTLLQNDGASSSSNGSYARRQMYCRTCAALAVALRLGKSDSFDDIKQSPSDEGKNNGSTGVAGSRSRHPYERYTPTEYKHMHSILVDRFLPEALNMREDRVSNVRLTLVAAIKVMPDDILEKDEVQTILTTLEEEMRTWDSGFGSGDYGDRSAAGGSAVTRSTAPISATSSSTSAQAPQQRGRERSSSRSSKSKTAANEEKKPATPDRRGKVEKSGSSKRRKDEEKTKKDAEKKSEAVDDGDDDGDDNSLSSI